MIVKAGVRLLGVKPETVAGMMVADSAFLSRYGHGFTLTSCVDGTHKSGSLHYAGLAFDFRLNDLPDTEHAPLVLFVRERLGAEWDVLLEGVGTPDLHGHAEYQPKTGLQSNP